MAEPIDKAQEEYLFDVRLLERHLVQGRVTRKQLEERLAACPDMAEQVETVEMGRLSSTSRPVRG